MSNTRYSYFRVKTNKGTGYVCVALDCPPKGVSGVYKIGVSHCSPQDTFNKKIARKIAAGRLKTIDRDPPPEYPRPKFRSKLNGGVSSDYQSFDSIQDAFRDAIRQQVIFDQNTPSWLRNAKYIFCGLNESRDIETALSIPKSAAEATQVTQLVVRDASGQSST